MPRSKNGDVDYEWSSGLIDELRKAGFTPSQIKHILPNILVESGWGRADAVQGDWKQDFKGDEGGFNVGRGYIQLTGYDNYRKMEEDTGIPLTKNPKLASLPENSARIAAAYLKRRQKEFGDVQDLSYNSFESVYRALAPKNKNPESRKKEIEKYNYRLATDDDVLNNMPAYDPSAWTVEPDGSLRPNSTPNQR